MLDHQVDDAVRPNLQARGDDTRQQAMDFRGRDLIAELHELVAALVKVEREGFFLFQMSDSWFESVLASLHAIVCSAKSIASRLAPTVFML